MELTEIYADERGETHFRKAQVDLESRDYAPPSEPLQVSTDMRMAIGNFLVAPPGWDKDFHATPRRQLAVMVSGQATITVTDGETITVGPGSVVLLNDQASKSHLTQIQGSQDASFLLVGFGD